MMAGIVAGVGALGRAVPSINANYAYVANIDTNEIYYRKAARYSIVPASLTKLMTALIVANEKDGSLSDTATLLASDISSTATFTQAGLQADDVISFQGLLVGMMLPSGSEAAQAAGRVVGNILSPPSGGLPAFTAEMNAVASSLGMNGTVFTNTFADDDSGAHYSTTADVWRLLKAFMGEPVLAAIVDLAEWTATVSGPNARDIFMVNTNPILEDDGIVGGKTGTYIGLSGDPAIYNLANVWVAPNGERVGIVTAHSDSLADRQADQRAIIAQLPIDFPALAIPIFPGNGAGAMLLENETDTVLLEDNSSALLLEG